MEPSSHAPHTCQLDPASGTSSIDRMVVWVVLVVAQLMKWQVRSNDDSWPRSPVPVAALSLGVASPPLPPTGSAGLTCSLAASRLAELRGAATPAATLNCVVVARAGFRNHRTPGGSSFLPPPAFLTLEQESLWRRSTLNLLLASSPETTPGSCTRSVAFLASGPSVAESLSSRRSVSEVAPGGNGDLSTRSNGGVTSIRHGPLNYIVCACVSGWPEREHTKVGGHGRRLLATHPLTAAGLGSAGGTQSLDELLHLPSLRNSRQEWMLPTTTFVIHRTRPSCVSCVSCVYLKKLGSGGSLGHRPGEACGNEGAQFLGPIPRLIERGARLHANSRHGLHPPYIRHHERSLLPPRGNRVRRRTRAGWRLA
jgi:hypothetical protein